MSNFSVQQQFVDTNLGAWNNAFDGNPADYPVQDSVTVSCPTGTTPIGSGYQLEVGDNVNAQVVGIELDGVGGITFTVQINNQVSSQTWTPEFEAACASVQ